MDEEILKMKWIKKNGGEDWKIVVPRGMENEILDEMHGSLLAGHF